MRRWKSKGDMGFGESGVSIVICHWSTLLPLESAGRMAKMDAARVILGASLLVMGILVAGARVWGASTQTYEFREGRWLEMPTTAPATVVDEPELDQAGAVAGAA